LFLNNMAWTLSEEMSQAEQGCKWADEAVRRCGEVPLILDTRGVILTRLGRYDEAVRDLSAAARDYPTGAVYYHLARAYKKQGKLDDFHTARTRARELGIAREQLQPSELADWDEVMNP
jgi:predicted Zn-dependent protease